MTDTAKFIALEGLEGAGKSTALAIIRDLLDEAGIPFICTREPGGTPMAEEIRQLVKSGRQEAVCPATELLLMYAARVQLVEHLIKPNLARGRWVIADRHDLSTLAYQGGGRQIPLARIRAIKQAVLGDFVPDITLFLDVEPETGLQRARGRGELDRIEQEDLAFFRRTRAMYLKLLPEQKNPCRVDANQPLAQVRQQIETVVRQWLS